MDPFCYLCLTFVFIILSSKLSVPCSLEITFWERTDLLALLCVMVLVFLSLSHMVSGLRCGT